MALLAKQDFSPRLLSRSWVSAKCGPNMLRHTRTHILSVLESGLLFREDSTCVETGAASSEACQQAGSQAWLTRGEKWITLTGVTVCLLVAPPRLPVLRPWNVCLGGACLLVPCVVRAIHASRTPQTSLRDLAASARKYTALCRRTMACLKEFKLLNKGIGSVWAVLESTSAMLCSQQSDLARSMARASSVILVNFPWLTEDISWTAIEELGAVKLSNSDDDIVKIHHAFLVIQSTLLKHIAMAHFIQTSSRYRSYNNHNQRLYWLHSELLTNLNEEINNYHDPLERMYRLLTSCGTEQNSVSNGLKMARSSWLYSDVHAGIACAAMELRAALNTCNHLDAFLDGCHLNERDIDSNILNSDIDALMDNLTKCFSTMQNSQIRLKKLQARFAPKTHVDNTMIDNDEVNTECVEEFSNIVNNKEEEPIRDEVFFYVKTEEDEKNLLNELEAARDITTAPGKKERDATQIVLNELKRKLVKREDLMREREAKALEETMPELKGKIPQFPRQSIPETNIQTVKLIGYITKLKNRYRKNMKRKLLHEKYFRRTRRNVKLKINSKLFLNSFKSSRNTELIYSIYTGDEIQWDAFDKLGIYYGRISHSKIRAKGSKNKIKLTKILTGSELQNSHPKATELPFIKKVTPLGKTNGDVLITTSSERSLKTTKITSLSSVSDSDTSEKDLLLNVTSNDDVSLYEISSDSDSDSKKPSSSLLKDVRRNRVVRQKNHPVRRSNSIANDRYEKTKEECSKKENIEDEGEKPIEYSFGTGMALASMFRVEPGQFASRMGQEEVFVGDGEISSDSGTEDA